MSRDAGEKEKEYSEGVPGIDLEPDVPALTMLFMSLKAERWQK